jgi:hypothetical protein
MDVCIGAIAPLMFEAAIVLILITARVDPRWEEDGNYKLAGVESNLWERTSLPFATGATVILPWPH